MRFARRSRTGATCSSRQAPGSGKTECFTLPVLDGLLREIEEGTLGQPGVRALLLYPMNALANDQLKRLRVLLRDVPAITFGRYIGETLPEQKAAEADFRTRFPSEELLANELISREVMQDRPPHILLTNYAMLEYLLLRPEDSSLFDGPTGEHWRYLVLDEVHVYGGAQGTEVGMLVRRLRDRVIGSRAGALQCFGTSATLGRGERDYPDLVRFGEALFAEPFEWVAGNPQRQDVVGARKRSLVRREPDGRLDTAVIRALRQHARSGGSAAELAALCDGPAPSGPEVSVGEYLASLLAGDERMIALQRRLEAGSADLHTVADDLFDSPEARRLLVDLVDLGVLARPRPADAPLLPARYHFFLRALEGAFVCLHPEHDRGDTALLLSRHERCPSCARRGREAAMFELGVCRRCGSEYLVGAREPAPGGHRIIHASPTSTQPIRALLGQPLADDEDDEDQSIGQATSDAAVAVSLCPACGLISERDVPGCGCSVRATRIWIARDTKEDGALRRCIACGTRAGNDPIYRFLTGSDAPVSVIATDLYQEIPPAQEPELRHEVGQGRRLLAFSDSRQDAAFFAPFLERTYKRAVQRRLIAQAALTFGSDIPRIGDLVDPVVKLAEQSLVLDPDDGRVANRRAASLWLTRELLALDRRQSLDGTGVAELRLALPRRCDPPAGLLKLGFAPEEALDLIRLLLETVRAAGAVSVLEGVDIRDPEFAPRNQQISIRGSGTAARVLAWQPSKNLNGRIDILRRVFAAKAIGLDPRELVAGIWRMLTDPNGPWEKLLIQDATSDGPVWRLDAERFEVALRGSSAPLRCSRCQQLWWRTVAGICPSFRCDGTTRPIEDPATLDEDHYARLYRELEPIGIAVEEHTAQWKSIKASAIQDDFVHGRINVLSCSTTFELGVDVGEVQAVLLRNVPPSPANYVQRAGRAGRRTDSAALVVTYAQRRSHDLTYFEDPHAMVDGLIPTPRVVLENVPIVRRHLHSLAFAAFQREVGDHRTVEDFFLAPEGSTRRCDDFIEWLGSRPQALGDAARRVVPPAVSDALGLESWSWVDALTQPTDEEPSFGWLDRARGEVLSDVESLQLLIDEASEEEQFGRAAHLKRLRVSIIKRPLLGYLASRNVLPKYGFPVDVVELNLARSGDADAGNLELSRDLTLAIADYAPGAMTVAAKKLWRSIGLVRRSDRDWPLYEWVRCRSCDAFRHGLIQAPLTCPACGSEEHAEQGKFVLPIYGFAGEAAENAGETRPVRQASIETFFGSYRDAVPDFEDVPGTAVSRRFSRQGRITVINRGPLRRGFRICEWCGFGQPIHGTKAPASHRRVDQPGKACGGRFAHLHLGHEYLTDVLELQLPLPAPHDDLRSALYALLEAAIELDVARDDIDGTAHFGAVDRPSLILFDAVPGGAGHVQRLGMKLPVLITAASRRIADCECGEETSCYACLRGYRNQIWHEKLTRRGAQAVLRTLLEH